MVKELLAKFPPAIQYVAVIGLIMLLLYICLIVTRLLGQNHGEKITYDDPVAYDKTIPDPANVSLFKSKKKAKGTDEKSEE